MNLRRTGILALLVVKVLFFTSANAANLDGQWTGYLKVGEQSVPIIFNVQHSDDQIAATMDSPMQGATGIPVKSVAITGNNVIFDIAVAGARYESTLSDQGLTGSWKQSGQVFPLNMSRGLKTELKKN